MSQNINDSAGFVILSEVVPEIIQDIRYYSTYNFVGTRIDGYDFPCALLTIEAAKSLKKVSDDVEQFGYRLKIFDAYRPQMAVDNFLRWAKDLNDTRMKKYFYPEVDKEKLFELGYLGEKSRHSRGSTVDLTLFDMQSGNDLDMGCKFDFFGEIANPNYKALTDKQIKNRRLLRDFMTKHKFIQGDTEWWHFTLKDEPYPNTYFNFKINALNKK